MSLLLRFIMTAIAMCGYAFANAVYSPVATLGQGQAVGGQLLRSDGAFLQSSYMMSAWSGGFVVITLLFLIMLLALWWGPLRRAIKILIAPLILIMVLVGVDDARAYYEKTDYTEAYSIGPNETAIIVPDVGNNADTQVQMDSEAYLKSKQIPHKRVIIPHAKLSGSGSFYDFYVPSARLFIVDRTTYSHEWVGKGRGTNTNVDESIPCQSKEGLDMTLGISVGTRVKEEDAAKFLYNFGTETLDPKLNRADPAIVFRSVFYSRKVADVMNDIGRKAVQTFACEETTSRTFDDVNRQASDIMKNIRAKAIDYFASVGITVQFIGWADTFTFSPPVQKAIDDRYIVDKLGSSLVILQAIANLKVQEGLGSGLDKHGLPIVVTPDMLNILAGLAAKTTSIPPPTTVTVPNK